MSRSKDLNLREELIVKDHVSCLTRKSKILPGLKLDISQTRIMCPGCKKKHWWGMRKRHHCKTCGIWVMNVFSASGYGEYLFLSETKEGLGETPDEQESRWRKLMKKQLEELKEKE